MRISPLLELITFALLAATILALWLRRSRAKALKLVDPTELPSTSEESIVERIETNPTALHESRIPSEEPRIEAILTVLQTLPKANEPVILAVRTDPPEFISREMQQSAVEMPASTTLDTATPCPEITQLQTEEQAKDSKLEVVVIGETTSNHLPRVQQPSEASASHENRDLGLVIQFEALDSDTLVDPISQLPEEDAHSDTETEPQPEEVINEVEPIVTNDNIKAPQRYRPPSQAAPRQQRTRIPLQPATRNGQAEVSFDIRLRLTLDRFGFCRLTLLPERKGQLDDEITVRHGGVSLGLTAQEDWYQDLEFSNIGDLLRDSIEMKGKLADNRRVRWLLTARNLYVLASHQRASGFVSTPRMTLGRSHIVLCTAELQEQVEAILILAGCAGYAKLQEAEGMPAGWIGFRDVAPTQSLPLEGSDSFYAIKPAPDIEINLEGGIWLQNSVWLAGYPPKIRLLGQANTSIKVLIDGKDAQRNAEGYLIADGCDSIGQHSIYCEGLSCSRTYSIEEPSESWEGWSAYKFDESEICGPLVQLTAKAAGRRVITVPMSTPLLLGAEPGQIFRCSPRNVTHWKGFVPFDVVWALPSYPLRCNKETVRILQFGNAPFSPRKGGSKAALDWCNAILDASRKGLRVESNSAEAAAHWHQYKKEARKIWRAAR